MLATLNDLLPDAAAPDDAVPCFNLLGYEEAIKKTLKSDPVLHNRDDLLNDTMDEVQLAATIQLKRFYQLDDIEHQGVAS